MSDTPLHRLYSHYSELPLSMRVLYTAALCILGSGYLFGLIYLFHSNSGRDGNALDLSYQDIVITYAGSGKDSKLEAALRGPMATMLPPDEAKAMISWVKNGSDRATYDASIMTTLDKRCKSCHDGVNPHLSNLDGYDNIRKVTEKDTGTDTTRKNCGSRRSHTCPSSATWWSGWMTSLTNLKTSSRTSFPEQRVRSTTASICRLPPNSRSTNNSVPASTASCATRRVRNTA